MELISTLSNAATVAFTSVPPVRASRREFTSTTREHFRVTPSLDARSNWCFRTGLIALRMPLKPNDSSRDGAGPRSRPSFAVISPCCNDLPAAGRPIDPHGEERGTAARLEPRGHRPTRPAVAAGSGCCIRRPWRRRRRASVPSCCEGPRTDRRAFGSATPRTALSRSGRIC